MESSPTKQPSPTGMTMPTENGLRDYFSSYPNELKELIIRHVTGNKLLKLSPHCSLRPLEDNSVLRGRHREQMEKIISCILNYDQVALDPGRKPTDHLGTTTGLWIDLAGVSRVNKDCKALARHHFTSGRRVVIHCSISDWEYMAEPGHIIARSIGEIYDEDERDRAKELTKQVTKDLDNVIKCADELVFVLVSQQEDYSRPRLEVHEQLDNSSHWTCDDDGGRTDADPVKLKYRYPHPRTEDDTESHAEDDGPWFGNDTSDNNDMVWLQNMWNGHRHLEVAQDKESDPRIISVLFADVPMPGQPGASMEVYAKVNEDGQLPDDHPIMQIARTIEAGKKDGKHKRLREFRILASAKEGDRGLPVDSQPYLKQISHIVGVDSVEYRMTPRDGTDWEFDNTNTTRYDAPARAREDNPPLYPEPGRAATPETALQISQELVPSPESREAVDVTPPSPQPREVVDITSPGPESRDAVDVTSPGPASRSMTSQTSTRRVRRRDSLRQLVRTSSDRVRRALTPSHRRQGGTNPTQQGPQPRLGRQGTWQRILNSVADLTGSDSEEEA